MNKKILVLGVGQNNFLSFLYSKLKSFDSTFIISAPFVRELHTNAKNDTWMYDTSLVRHKASFLAILQSFFLVFTDKHFYQTFFFILFVEKKFKKSIHFAFKHFQAKAFFITNSNFDEFDTFHFHYLQYSYLIELFLIPKKKKIVCTFWGSDLLRTSDILNFYIVKKALNRADVITCQSIELKEIILSKFGRNLEDKIKTAVFPVDERNYNEIILNRNNQNLISEFKEKYGYSLTKKNVLVGHNGSIFNNHLKIIEALSTLKHKSEIHLIINLNYAITHQEKLIYKDKLMQQLEKSEISFTLLETFFPKEELSLSRLATDIFIHMPVSDALSGTMLELLYASNIVITGSWLPYKTFSNIGLTYYELNEFNQISSAIDLIINDFNSEKEKANTNIARIENHFLSDAIIKNWISILN